MKHISTFSLGGGSWLTASIVQREFVRPGDEHVLVFTDTLYEDADAYRFGVQAAALVFGRRLNWVPEAEDFPDYRVDEAQPLETYAGNPAWRVFLAQLRDRTAEAVPELVWLVEGRDPWEVYRDVRYLGNSGADPCSRVEKREFLDAWMNANCTRDEAVVYFGIGDGEKHRYDSIHPRTGKPMGIRPRWAANGWNAQAPLIGRIEGDANPALYMAKEGLEPPRLYGLGYSHNNCGGMCCKAGIRHWKMRFQVQPERYAYDQMMEAKMRAFLGADVAFLTDRRKNARVPFTLASLAKELVRNPDLPTPIEPGDTGCGCMTDDADAA